MGKLFSIVETARRFGMTEQAMRDWVKKGYISVHEVGRARYIDEDAILALQDTVEDIKRQQRKLEALRDEIKGEYEYMRYQHDDEKNRRRYIGVINGAALRSGFFGTMVRLMKAKDILTDREATILTDYLNGVTLEAIATQFKLTRERVRQIVEKAIRKGRDIERIEDELGYVNNLRFDNEALKSTVASLKEKLARYEDTETEEKRKAIIANDDFIQLLSKKLCDCDISIRALNCVYCGLVRYNGSEQVVLVPPSKTIGDLCRLNKTDILRIRNAGKKTLAELDNFLKANGLCWGMDVDRIYNERVEMLLKKSE